MSEDLERIADLAAELFKRAEKEDLFVGAGYDPRLPDKKQEGPAVKRLKAALKASGRL